MAILDKHGTFILPQIFVMEKKKKKKKSSLLTRGWAGRGGGVGINSMITTSITFQQNSRFSMPRRFSPRPVYNSPLSILYPGTPRRPPMPMTKLATHFVLVFLP